MQRGSEENLPKGREVNSSPGKFWSTGTTSARIRLSLLNFHLNLR
jgi:hypothetical protein